MQSLLLSEKALAFTIWAASHHWPLRNSTVKWADSLRQPVRCLLMNELFILRKLFISQIFIGCLCAGHCFTCFLYTNIFNCLQTLWCRHYWPCLIDESWDRKLWYPRSNPRAGEECFQDFDACHYPDSAAPGARSTPVASVVIRRRS